MIEEAIDSLESEEEQIQAQAALATLQMMGLFEAQKEINVRMLLTGPIDETVADICARIVTIRNLNHNLDAMADLGRSYIKD